MPNGFTSFEIRNKSTKEPLDQLLIKDVFSKNYEIEIHNRITVNFKPLDNASITFDIFKYNVDNWADGDINSVFLAADITDIVSKRGTIASSFGSDSRYARQFSVEQFKENEILLVDRDGAGINTVNYIEEFKQRVNNCLYQNHFSYNAPTSINEGLDFLIVDRSNKIILEKIHYDCEIKRMYNGIFYADAAYLSETLYVTKIDTSELSKKYNNVGTISYSTIPRADVAYVGDGGNSVGSRLILDDFNATNIPTYRDYYQYVCFGLGRHFHVPDSIANKTGEELSFWDYNQIKKYLLCIYVDKK